jgi:hypothetical protein
MKKTPISILLFPAWPEHDINLAVKSVLRQDHSDFELLIADESEKFNKSAVRDPRIRYLSKNIKKGQIINIKNLMSGRYVFIMHSDNILFPNTLSVFFQFMEKNTKVGIIGAGAELVNTKGIFIRDILMPEFNSQIRLLLLKKNPFFSSLVLIRRKIFTSKRLNLTNIFEESIFYSFIVNCSSSITLRNLNQILFQKVISTDLKEENFNNVNRTNWNRLKQLRNFRISSTLVERTLHLKIIGGQLNNELDFSRSLVWLNKLIQKNDRYKYFAPPQLYDFFRNLLINNFEDNEPFRERHLLNLGGWSIEEELIRFLTSNLTSGLTILEFGSGNGTSKLLEYYQVISVEHDLKYFRKRSECHICIYSPIENGWYGRNFLREIQEYKIDAILIDGPPGDLREGVLFNIDIFTEFTCPIIFDDVDREKDKQIMNQFCEHLGYSFKIFKGSKKSFAYCIKGL